MEALVLFIVVKESDVNAMTMQCWNLQAVRDTPLLGSSRCFRHVPPTKRTQEDDINPCSPYLHLCVDLINGTVVDARMPVLVRVEEQRVQILCLRRGDSR